MAPSHEVLQVILNSTPAAIVLVNELGGIVFTNAPARRLFFEGHDATGQDFLQMLRTVSEELRLALSSDTDRLFTFHDGGDPETYHLAKTHVELEGEPQISISVRYMTMEISRQAGPTRIRTAR
jgi:PAS domain-containing protein